MNCCYSKQEQQIYKKKIIKIKGLKQAYCERFSSEMELEENMEYAQWKKEESECGHINESYETRNVEGTFQSLYLKREVYTEQDQNNSDPRFIQQLKKKKNKESLVQMS